jgi:hypothetical protein
MGFRASQLFAADAGERSSPQISQISADKT